MLVVIASAFKRWEQVPSAIASIISVAASSELSWLFAGFTKTVGLELAQKGNITCNAICPGYVFTDLVRNQLEATAKARNIPKVCSSQSAGLRATVHCCVWPESLTGCAQIMQDLQDGLQPPLRRKC